MVHISVKFPGFWLNPSVTTHVIELTDPFNAAHLLKILLQLSSVTSYFDVYSLHIAKYENKDIPKIHLTTEVPPLDPSTNEYSERETHMLDHCSQISILAIASRGSMFVSTVVLYSLAYDATDVMDNDYLATGLSAQIQINIALMGIVRKPSI